MKKTSNRLVFFGNERLSSGYVPEGAPVLEGLITAGYDIAAVVANFDPGVGRKRRQLEVAAVAEKYNIPVLLPKKLSDITPELQSFGAVAGVLVAYGKIIPQAILDIFPRGIINLHPSLLPLYRGSTPIEQVILDGSDETGVSIMKLVKAMDAGPIFVQHSLNLQGNETKQMLTQTLHQLGAQELLHVLPSILDGSAMPILQDEAKATYTPQLSKENSRLDLNKTATQLEREIRAYAQWPKSTAEVHGQRIVVTKAHAEELSRPNALLLACAENTTLAIDELIAPSGKTMSGEAFLRGYASIS